MSAGRRNNWGLKCRAGEKIEWERGDEQSFGALGVTTALVHKAERGPREDGGVGGQRNL